MKTILIVDDQAEVRELVEVTLRVGEYRILQASNGADAVQLAKAEVPDLIIMDVMMPGELDGVQATRQIKSYPPTRDCIVVILSGKGQVVDVQKGMDAGANDYFIKPFSPLELIEKVESVLVG